MNIKTLGSKEAVEAVEAMEDISDVREVAKQLDISFSGNSGIKTLKSKIITALEETEEEEENPLLHGKPEPIEEKQLEDVLGVTEEDKQEEVILHLLQKMHNC